MIRGRISVHPQGCDPNGFAHLRSCNCRLAVFDFLDFKGQGHPKVSNQQKKNAQIILILGALGLWSASTYAQSSDEKGLEISLSPYLWGTSIEGTSTIGSLPPLDIDASFSDLLSNLNIAFSMHTEFRKDDWVFVIDPTFLSLELELGLPPELPPEAVLEMEVDIWLVELWAGYRFTEKWEVIGGLRYQDQKIDVEGLPNPPFPENIGVSADWTDWFLGARFRTDLNPKWFLVWRGDVTVAGDSDTNWNTSIFFNRRIKDTMALTLGYRYFVDDFNDVGTYRWDVTQQGPVIGYTWVF